MNNGENWRQLYPNGPPTPSDESEDSWIDPLVEKFGDSPFVQAAGDHDRVLQLLAAGTPVTAEGVFAATQSLHLDNIKLLFDANTIANERLGRATAPNTSIDENYANWDFSPAFRPDWHEWYPILFASHATVGYEEEQSERRNAMVMLFLDHGADLYAIYRQPLRPPKPYPFPGEENTDLTKLGSEPPDPYAETGRHGDSSSVAPICGLRSVIHSILEDGGCIQPMFERHGRKLDIEHRDPLGRTLIHSACRSALGADAVLEGVLEDVHWDVSVGGLRRNPFAASERTPSLFHTLRTLGADLLACDYNGKHILHHLYEAEDPERRSWRPPVIRDSLKYIFANHQALINQPDRHGTFPLHSALQRRRRYPIMNKYTELAGLEDEIDELLAAGANSLARDSRDNTALHYLADEGLAEQVNGEHVRRLFKLFLDRGVDVNARNHSGRSALEIMLDDNGEKEQRRISQYVLQYGGADMPKLEDVEAEVFAMFDGAGVRWTEQDAKERTLLHLVAKHSIRRAASRARFLLGKGADPEIKDKDGRTALEIATSVKNREVVKVLTFKS